MKVEYGPPGAAGVKSLQYVSGDDYDGIGDDADYISLGIHQIAKPVLALGLGTAAYSWVTKRERLKKQALAVSFAAFVVQLITRPR